MALQGLEGALDGHHVETDSQVLSQRARIIDASGAGKLGRQGQPPDILRTECLYSQGGDQGGINASRQPEDHRAETAFANIITHAQYERIMQQGLVSNGGQGAIPRRLSVYNQKI